MSKKRLFYKLGPVFWSIVIFLIAQILTFATVWQQSTFLDEEGIYVPTQPPDIISIWPGDVVQPDGSVVYVQPFSALGPILIYFFVVIIVISLVLYFIPLHLLNKLMRILFAVLFGWGVFVALAIWLHWGLSLVLATIVGLVWLFYPRIWLHNIVMVLAMVSLASVFGHFISPWTAIALLGALAIYDLLAVRFGFMMWLAGRLSNSNAIPAFIFPRRGREWRSGIQDASFSNAEGEKPGERRFSILGGGDIAFPLLVSAACFFDLGFRPALTIGLFGLVGLIAAYVIQMTVLKGRPMPALPPIAVACVIGLLLVSPL